MEQDSLKRDEAIQNLQPPDDKKAEATDLSMCAPYAVPAIAQDTHPMAVTRRAIEQDALNDGGLLGRCPGAFDESLYRAPFDRTQAQRADTERIALGIETLANERNRAIDNVPAEEISDDRSPPAEHSSPPAELSSSPLSMMISPPPPGCEALGAAASDSVEPPVSSRMRTPKITKVAARAKQEGAPSSTVKRESSAPITALPLHWRTVSSAILVFGFVFCTGFFALTVGAEVRHTHDDCEALFLLVVLRIF